jgi:mRNA-degrading endonuclease RelE of RelBE toxin-antitoxin system
VIFRLDIDGETRDLVRRLAAETTRKIKAALRAIALDPDIGKALQEELAGLHSYRVGLLRVVYAIERSARRVHVVAIGPRRSIHEEVERARRRSER